MPARRISIALVLFLIVPSTGAIPSVHDNDAGTGRDAPSTIDPGFVVATDVLHSGRLLVPDTLDTYGIVLEAGDRVEVRAFSPRVCGTIYSPDGVARYGVCNSLGIEHVFHPFLADVSGTWYLRISGVSAEYQFVVARNSAAPRFLPVTLGQDDAGMGVDAPSTPNPAFLVATGIPRDATLARGVDDVDVFAFEAKARDIVSVSARAANACWSVLRPNETEWWLVGCTREDGTVRELYSIFAGAGIHYVRFSHLAPGPYRFLITLDGERPPPLAPHAVLERNIESEAARWLADQTQDDAGSGGDAPFSREGAVPVEPGVVYNGTGFGPRLDELDTYVFHAEAGQAFDGWSIGHVGCISLTDPDGERLGSECMTAGYPPAGLRMTLPRSGAYLFVVQHLGPGKYRMAFGLDAPAPDFYRFLYLDDVAEAPGHAPSG